MLTGVPTDHARIGIVDPLTSTDWDARVATLPGSGSFHSQAWARVLRDAYGFRPCYFSAQAGDVLTGVLPMMEVDSWLTGRRGVSLPFTDACEPLARTDAVLRELAREAFAEGRRRHWKYCELRGGCDRLGKPPSVEYHGHSLDLTPGVDALLQRLDPACRRAIRKAERSGLEIVLTREPAATEEFYALVCETRRRHGLPPPPRRFFHCIHEHLLAPGKGLLLLARQGRRVVAGALFLQFANRAIFKFGASLTEAQALRPNNLLMWRAIDWHTRAGFERLDFGRTDLGHEGLRRFKLSWGALERLVGYHRQDLGNGRSLPPAVGPTGWHNAIFRHLPIPVSQLIGAVIYRHVA